LTDSLQLDGEYNADSLLNCVNLVRLLWEKLSPAKVATMPIKSYLDSAAFGPDATAIMGEAFDAACKELHVTEQSKTLRTLVAILIIAAARCGELNPVRLQTAAVEGFAIARAHQDPDAPNSARAAS
jgi:hypothetical protein